MTLRHLLNTDYVLGTILHLIPSDLPPPPGDRSVVNLSYRWGSGGHRGGHLPTTAWLGQVTPKSFSPGDCLVMLSLQCVCLSLV